MTTAEHALMLSLYMGGAVVMAAMNAAGVTLTVGGRFRESFAACALIWIPGLLLFYGVIQLVTAVVS